MKKYMTLLLTIAMLVGLATPTHAAQQPVQLQVNDTYLEPDVPAFIQNGRTFVPVRFIGEYLGLLVDWKRGPWEGTITVTLEDPDTGRTIYIDAISVRSTDGITFSDDYQSDAPTYILKNDRTFLPIRYIANALHMDIRWNQDTRTVSLSSSDKVETYPVYVERWDEGGNFIEKSPHAIQYRDGAYYILGLDMTVAEFRHMISQGDDYKKLETPNYFYRSNIFSLTPDRSEIKAYTAG